MDENQIVTIMNLVRIIALGLINSIVACLYAIPLIFIRQFHKPVHLLTLNVCIAACTCSTYWAIFFIMNAYYPLQLYSLQSCLPIIYGQNMVICQGIYALCMVSLNRLLTIIYKNKALFRTKRWVAVCITAQWTLAALLPMPILFSDSADCLISGLELKYRIYVIIIAILIPTICLITTNSIIFIYTRRSTQRIQPMNGDNAQATGLSARDARLLKHMIFIFVVFFCGWTPIYIAMAVNWTGTAVSPIVLNVLFTIPALTVFINIGDLFLYNHELRTYLTKRQQVEPSVRSTRTKA